MLKIWSLNLLILIARQYRDPRGRRRGHERRGIADYDLGMQITAPGVPSMVASNPNSSPLLEYRRFPWKVGGTSAAAPHVAGAAALIKSANPSYTQLWDALIAATVDIGDQGKGQRQRIRQARAADYASFRLSSNYFRIAQSGAVVVTVGRLGANRGTSKVIFYGGTESFQYVSWSDISKCPTGADRQFAGCDEIAQHG